LQKVRVLPNSVADLSVGESCDIIWSRKKWRSRCFGVTELSCCFWFSLNPLRKLCKQLQAAASSACRLLDLSFGDLCLSPCTG